MEEGRNLKKVEEKVKNGERERELEIGGQKEIKEGKLEERFRTATLVILRHLQADGAP